MSVKQIYPNSQRDSYSENDSVDFLLSFEGEKLKRNTVRLSGYLTVVKADDTPINGDVKYDGMLGIHAFCDSFNTQIDGVFIENQQAYARAVKTAVQANQSGSSQGAETSKSIELRCGNDEMTKEILKGLDGNKPLPFSMQPHICLNNVLSGDLQYNGGVMVNVRLAPVLDVFYGADAVGVKYSITDLKMSYETVVDDGKKEEVVMLTKTMVRNNLVSSNHQLSTKVPVLALSVSGTFIKTNNLSKSTTNNTACEVLDVTRLEFEMNDGTGYQSYALESRNEILYNYILANGNSQHNDFSLKKLSQGIGYGIGLNFNDSTIDFHEKKFGLSVISSASNVDPYTLFMYFTGVIKV